MVRKIELKYDWRLPVAKIFRKFGEGKWSAEKIRDITGIKNSQGFFSQLHYNGIIRPYNGKKRCKTNNKTGGTDWVFSPWFVDYMNSGGLSIFESSNAA